MNKQIIICVESNENAKTDNIYIKETLSRFFLIDNSVKFSFVNMNTKSNYKSKKVLNKIGKCTKEYEIGETIVVYCIDVDKYDANPTQVKENAEIGKFVSDNGYELIWFCRDIEEVFLKTRVDKKEKVQRAIEFKKKKMVNEIAINSLEAKVPTKGKSNILKVLGKYLERK